MTREDLMGMDLKLDSIGKFFKFDTGEYYYLACNSYAWIRRFQKPANTPEDTIKNRAEYINHPIYHFCNFMINLKALVCAY